MCSVLTNFLLLPLWCLIKIKGKVIPVCNLSTTCWIKHHTMNMYCGYVSILPFILNFRTRWMWVVGFMPQSLYPWGNSPWHLLGRSLGGPQGWSRCTGKEKNSLPFMMPCIGHFLLYRKTGHDCLATRQEWRTEKTGHVCVCFHIPYWHLIWTRKTKVNELFSVQLCFVYN